MASLNSNHHIINCETGEEVIRPHTPEELTLNAKAIEEIRGADLASAAKQQRRTDAINVLKEKAKDDKSWHAILVALGFDDA